MAMLRRVGAANADGVARGDWNLIILHHTDCGMTDLAAFPELLAEYFEIPSSELESKSVSDPVGSVRVDVDIVKRNLRGSAFLVSGLVYGRARPDPSKRSYRPRSCPTSSRTARTSGDLE